MQFGARIGETDGAGVTLRRYVHGPGVDEPLAQYEGTGVTDRRFLHADERGSIVAISIDDGSVAGINRYDQYGVAQGTLTGSFGYTGQAWLPELGLYYKARMYDPKLGRFMQPDPIGYAGGMNLYAYVGNDPVNLTDPLGLQEEIVITGTRLPRSAWNPGELDNLALLQAGQYFSSPSPGSRGENRPRPGPVPEPQNNSCAAPSGGQSDIPRGAGAKSFSEAESIARQIANEELARTRRIAPPGAGHNDIYDAERHARWVYRMSVSIGSGWASLFATGHEGEGMLGGQPFIEMRMDINNNRVGLDAARNGTGMPARSTPGLMYIRGDELVRRGC